MPRLREEQYWCLGLLEGWCARVQKARREAEAHLEQRRVENDLELLLEANLNQEDLDRLEAAARADGEERGARYMKLFADYQAQKTHLARAVADARDARRDAERAEAARAKLEASVAALEVRGRGYACVAVWRCGGRGVGASGARVCRSRRRGWSGWSVSATRATRWTQRRARRRSSA